MSVPKLAWHLDGPRVSIADTTAGTTMSGTEDLRGSRMQERPSETEVARLLQESAKQHEEYRRLADLADISDQGELSHPRYAWDNPIGLVVTGSPSAELV